MVRDRQQSKCYAAEKSVFTWASNAAPDLNPPGCFDEVRDVERYVAKVWSRATVARHYPKAILRWNAPPRVGDGRARVRAGGCATDILMPRASRKDWIILHELSHAICQRQFGMDAEAHGWQFCSIYLNLVKWMLGAEVAAKLKAAFRAKRVRFVKPRPKRALTPEQSQALRDRMAAMRASRKGSVSTPSDESAASA